MPTLEIPEDLVSGDPLQISSAASLFTAENFVAWMLFGAIGFVAFIYGKKLGKIGPLVLGLLLMGYPTLSPTPGYCTASVCCSQADCSTGRSSRRSPEFQFFACFAGLDHDFA
jgi:hypothetical protein